MATAGSLWLWMGLAVVAAACSASQAGERVLLDFDKDFDPAKVPTTDVKVELVKKEAGAALRIASGHRQDWPGVTLKAPQGKWDLSPFAHLALDAKNVGTNEATVCCRVDNPGADGVRNCVTGHLTLKPGESGTLRVEIERKPPSAVRAKLFGMRGYPDGSSGPERAIDPRNVTQLLVFVPRPKEDHTFEIDNIRVGGSYVPPPVDPDKVKSFFPFIDTFGQYVHKDWPGKTHSLDDLKTHLEAERKDLADKPGPAEWDQYGGWKDGPALKATGFFRVEKIQSKWWLVDPEGKLFWSHGTDCVRANDSTPTDGRQGWFQDFPGDKAEFKEFFSTGRTLHGHYAGKTVTCFSFLLVNCKRKYGDGWRDAVADMAHRRLRSWGMNTIANWSDPAVYLMKRTPYTATVHFGGKLLEGSQGYWGKFRDVFDPGFRDEVRKAMAAQTGKAAGDPWCIGFFVDNEIAWGDEVSLAVAALASPPDQVAKKVFLDDLKAKYGDIAKLNAAWGTSHASWDALLAHRGAPDKAKAHDDLAAFYTKTAETYFKTIREAVKEVAPNQLYLGCRFAWVNDRAARAAAPYCDVVSYNFYRRSIAGFRYPGGDKPLIVGEFHFGALDRGMFHTGLVPVKDQAERAKAYRDYVEGALRHPQFVGTHWFKYTDEPATGRALDEENYQIGLLDGCDTPYPETRHALREVGYGLYTLRAGGK
ncbi:MAG TPA: beta-galactosidase [Planctomycetota bacterium]|nr:beta-galactosidase [Planctomycetota bacterium]